MGNGLIVSKDGASVTSNNPKDIAVDSTFMGAMKVEKRIWIRTIPGDWDSYVTIVGKKWGIKSYKHNLGYAPAFLLYYYVGSVDATLGVGSAAAPYATLMPTLATSAVSPMLFTHAESDSENIIVYGIPDAPEQNLGMGVFQRESAMLLVIFAEDLDENA